MVAVRLELAAVGGRSRSLSSATALSDPQQQPTPALLTDVATDVTSPAPAQPSLSLDVASPQVAEALHSLWRQATAELPPAAAAAAGPDMNPLLPALGRALAAAGATDDQQSQSEAVHAARLALLAAAVEQLLPQPPQPVCVSLAGDARLAAQLRQAAADLNVAWPAPALLSAKHLPANVRLHLQFAGQGQPVLAELTAVAQQHPAARTLIELAADSLAQQVDSPQAAKLALHTEGLNLRDWLAGQHLPPEEYLMAAHVSFPLITLVQLAHYIAFLAETHTTHAEMVARAASSLGHSQGERRGERARE